MSEQKFVLITKEHLPMMKRLPTRYSDNTIYELIEVPEPFEVELQNGENVRCTGGFILIRKNEVAGVITKQEFQNHFSPTSNEGSK